MLAWCHALMLGHFNMLSCSLGLMWSRPPPGPKFLQEIYKFLAEIYKFLAEI